MLAFATKHDAIMEFALITVLGVGLLLFVLRMADPFFGPGTPDAIAGIFWGILAVVAFSYVFWRALKRSRPARYLISLLYGCVALVLYLIARA
ncbi:MAG: hypothetical protein ABII82_10985 [Verrucomicrobiota bacterium]